MYKAGYDPPAFVSFFEKMQAQEKKKPGTLLRHSLRILRLRNESGIAGRDRQILPAGNTW